MHQLQLLSIGRIMIWTMRWIRRSLGYVLVCVCLSIILASLVLFQTTDIVARKTGTGHTTEESQINIQSSEEHQMSHENRSTASKLQRRRNLLESLCRKRLNPFFNRQKLLKRVNSSHFKAVFVDDEHKTLYCSVPKVACTNWKRILLVLTGKMNTTRPADLLSPDVHGELQKTFLTSLATYSSSEIEVRLKTYFKFLFVRDPFDRLISAYINKLTTSYNTYFRSRFGRGIVRKFRTNATEQSLTTGNDVTFDEFVQYLLDPLTTAQRPLNPHWRPATQLCLPCLIQYDVVGKYETLSDDVRVVLERMGVAGKVEFPPAPAHQRNSTLDVIRKQFANISSTDIHRLWELYSDDYKLFGYPYPASLLNNSAYENMVFKEFDDKK